MSQPNCCPIHVTCVVVRKVCPANIIMRVRMRVGMRAGMMRAGMMRAGMMREGMRTGGNEDGWE